MTTKPQSPSEYQEQVVVAEWLDCAVGHDGWFHPPNEGIRDPRTGAKLKKAGLKPGVADIIIMARPPAWPWAPGAVIEMKRRGDENKKIPESQSRWLAAQTARNWLTAVCYGAEDAVTQLMQWGYRKQR